MKHFISMVGIVSIVVLAPVVLQAKGQPSFEERVEAAAKVSQDAHKTPTIIKLARAGETTKLNNLFQHIPKQHLSALLDTHDDYGNNLFHVAKDTQTLQIISSMIRQVYGAKATQQITRMVDQRNEAGETAIHAQINASHPFMFRLLYPYSSLKRENDIIKNQLARQHGSGPDIFTKNKAIYCQKIHELASSKGGYTILQSAKYQANYNEEMAPLANALGRIIPCLAEN